MSFNLTPFGAYSGRHTITMCPDGYTSIQLVNELIDWFNSNGISFIVDDSWNGELTINANMTYDDTIQFDMMGYDRYISACQDIDQHLSLIERVYSLRDCVRADLREFNVKCSCAKLDDKTKARIFKNVYMALSHAGGFKDDIKNLDELIKAPVVNWDVTINNDTDNIQELKDIIDALKVASTTIYSAFINVKGGQQ